MNSSSRRSFLKISALAGATALTGINKTSAAGQDKQYGEKDDKSLVFLFQGDSITDGNRGRSKDPNHIMGHGYAFSVASRVGADFASSGHIFYNRGVSGNKVTDLQKRWKEDALDLKPDVLSILVGINDVSGMMNKPVIEEADIDSYETVYRDILIQSKQANPELLFVLGLPFVYEMARVKENAKRYADTIQKISVRVKKLATEFNAIVADYPAAFEKGTKKAPIDYWIWDGIHPTVPGHELMTREWIHKVSARLGFLNFYKYR